MVFWSLDRIGFSFLLLQVTACHRHCARWERRRREDAAACPQPLLRPSRDRDEREDEELQEAREGLKAEKQQQEPASLMAELIKRKEK